MSDPHRRCIWIDLDNTPHVPFFKPIIARLGERGYRVLVTARDAYNVRPLLELHQLDCTILGRHYGKRKAMKVAGTLYRAVQLALWSVRHKPVLAVSHGSRAQMLAARALAIPTVVLADYEHVTHFMRADHTIVPEVIPRETAALLSQSVFTYPGIKEDVYVAGFRPDPLFPGRLGLDHDKIVVTVRPPATEAHYHSEESDALFAAALERLAGDPNTQTILLPRSEGQRSEIRRRFAALVERQGVIVPSGAVSGLDLVWQSDLVISGGGTMNREAAALGIPVYSIFRGPIGSVDKYLAASGRLTLCESAQDVHERIRLCKRERADPVARSSAALDRVVQNIESLLKSSAAAAVGALSEPRP